MTDLPLTRQRMSIARQDAIRAAVRDATGIPFDEAPSRLAELNDAEAFYTFLSDPAVHAPIYNLPRPLTVQSVHTFIAQKQSEQTRGEGLLLLRIDAAGEVVGYSEFDIWPEWGAGDLGGALRADRQGQGKGGVGALQTFTWMFQVLNLELIVVTGARDNVRTARMMDGLGLVRKGEIVSHRPDGVSRPSLVWEVTRGDWFKRHPDLV